jgi:phytoene dehydrogenase-like protein
MAAWDVIVIGAGPNGLTAASFLARSGLKVLVLEKADRPGGCAVTAEIAPGFHCPALAHSAALDPAVISALGLGRHGLQIVRPDAHACAPTRDGGPLVLWTDTARAARSIAAFSSRDAASYPRFLASFARVSGVLRMVSASAPPAIDHPSAGDLISLLRATRRFRALGKADAYRLLRWLPMPVADLAGEWFETEPLRATVSAGGVLGSFLGPWSAGSAALLLLLGAEESHPVGSGWFARGGIGAVTDALAAAARQAGVQIRTTADVRAITVDDNGATGVVLAGGEELAARAIASSLDPKQTLLGLVSPVHLPPDFVRRIRNIRMHGTLAKVNYAASGLPQFTGVSGGEQPAALSGRIRLARDIAGIERAFDAAKYGGYSSEPWIELTIPSISDPSLAPAGQHVVSAYVQFTPYHLRSAHWDTERDRLGEIVTSTITSYAPGFDRTVLARQVITPLDLERTHGLTSGHIFHGELALDQFFAARPVLGWARYRTPIEKLFLCGSGTHPGTGLNGRSGSLASAEILKELKRTRGSRATTR